MAARAIPVVYIQSKELLLRIKKEGIYSIKEGKVVTIKDVERAIEHDERLIQELKAKVNPDTYKLLEELDAKYDEVKDTKEWKSLCDAHNKINEYLRLLKVYKRDDCEEVSSYDEIKRILDQHFLKKYHKIVNENIYKELYSTRMTLKYSNETYYINHIASLEKSIQELKNYCRENPSSIRGAKKRKLEHR